MTLVPLNRKCLATLGWIDGALRSRYFRASSVSGVLDTGTDSPRCVLASHKDRQCGKEYPPVSMLSFTIQSPDTKIQSHGTWFNEGSENSKTSPGTRSWEETDLPTIEIEN
jgi:hypothetical protein